MQEHGVLRRILSIYDESIRRIRTGKTVPEGILTEAAEIVRRFIEDHHEKLEENDLFPRFRNAGRLEDLVEILNVQHQAGRRLTETVLRQVGPAARGDEQARRTVAAALGNFQRMYRVHADREDTVLFPAFRMLLTPKEYDALGEKFERMEEELFGREGFERMVVRVAGLEMQLGIYDLTALTPKL